MTSPDEQFLQEVIETWQSLFSEPLDLEDAREIDFNLTGYFDLLDEIDKENNENSEEIKCEK